MPRARCTAVLEAMQALGFATERGLEEPPESFSFLEHVVEATARYLVCRRCGARSNIEAPHFRALLKPCTGTATTGQAWFRDEVLAGREPQNRAA